MNSVDSIKSFSFSLNVEDGWPPISVECLPFKAVDLGYKLLSPPLFLKNLSVDDIIVVDEIENEVVWRWHHVFKSNRTTVWLLDIKKENILVQAVISKLKAIGCVGASLPALGCFSIDVPEDVHIQNVDEILKNIDEDVCAAVFPSMRHPE